MGALDGRQVAILNKLIVGAGGLAVPNLKLKFGVVVTLRFRFLTGRQG